MTTNRQEFLELLQRYIDGTCSSQEKQMMDYWYELLDQKPAEPTDADSENQQETRLWASIQQRIQGGDELNPQSLIHKERPPNQ